MIPAKLLKANGWERGGNGLPTRRPIRTNPAFVVRYVPTSGLVWLEIIDIKPGKYHDLFKLGRTHDIGVLNMLVAALEAME